MKILLFAFVHLVMYANFEEKDIPVISNNTGSSGAFGESVNPFDYYEKVGLNNEIATIDNMFLSPSHFLTISKNDDLKNISNKQIYINVKKAIDNSGILAINSSNPLLSKIQDIFTNISNDGFVTNLKNSEQIHFYANNTNIFKIFIEYEDKDYEEAVNLTRQLNNSIIKIVKVLKEKEKNIDKNIENKAKKEEPKDKIYEKLTSSFHYRIGGFASRAHCGWSYRMFYETQLELGELFLEQNERDITFSFNKHDINFFVDAKNSLLRYGVRWQRGLFTLGAPYSTAETKKEELQTIKAKYIEIAKPYFASPKDMPLQNANLLLETPNMGVIDLTYKTKYKFNFRDDIVWKIKKADILGINFSESAYIFPLFWKSYSESYEDIDGQQGVWSRIKRHIDNFFHKMEENNNSFLKIPNVLLMRATPRYCFFPFICSSYFYEIINFNRAYFFNNKDFTNEQKEPSGSLLPSSRWRLTGPALSGFDQNAVFKIEDYVKYRKDEKIFPSIILKERKNNKFYVDDISYLKEVPPFIESVEMDGDIYKVIIILNNMDIGKNYITNINFIYKIDNINDINDVDEINRAYKSDMEKQNLKNRFQQIIKKKIENIIVKNFKNRVKDIDVAIDNSLAGNLYVLNFSSCLEYNQENIGIERNFNTNSFRNNIEKEKMIINSSEETNRYLSYIDKLTKLSKEVSSLDNIITEQFVEEVNCNLFKIYLPLDYEKYKDIYNPIRDEEWNLRALSDAFNREYKIINTKTKKKLKMIVKERAKKEVNDENKGEDKKEKEIEREIDGILFKSGSQKILKKEKNEFGEYVEICLTALFKNINNETKEVKLVLEIIPYCKEVPKILDEEIESFKGPIPIYDSKNNSYNIVYNMTKKKEGNLLGLKFFDAEKQYLEDGIERSIQKEDTDLLASAFNSKEKREYYSNIQIYEYNGKKCYVFSPKKDLNKDIFKLKCFHENIEIEKDDILNLNCSSDSALLKFDLEMIENDIFSEKGMQMELIESITNFTYNQDGERVELTNSIYPLLTNNLYGKNRDEHHRNNNLLYYKKDGKFHLVLEINDLDLAYQNFNSIESNDEHIDWILQFKVSTNVEKSVILNFPLKLILYKDKIEKEVAESKSQIFNEYISFKESLAKKELGSRFCHVALNISTNISEEGSKNALSKEDESDNITNFYSYSSYEISKNCGDVLEIPKNAFDVEENSIKIGIYSNTPYYDKSVNRDNIFIILHGDKNETYINDFEVRQIIDSENRKNYIEIPLSKVKNMFESNENIELRVVIFPTARLRGTNKTISKKRTTFEQSGLSLSSDSYSLEDTLKDSYIKAREPILISYKIEKSDEIKIKDIQKKFFMEKDNGYDVEIKNIGIANFTISFNGFKESDNHKGIYSNLLLTPEGDNIELVTELKNSLNMSSVVSKYSIADLDRIESNNAIFTLNKKHSINSNINLKKSIVSRNGFVVEINSQATLINDALEKIKIKDISFVNNKMKIDVESRVMPISCKIILDEEEVKKEINVEHDRNGSISFSSFIFEDIDLLKCREILLYSGQIEKKYVIDIEELDAKEKYRGKLTRLSIDNPLKDDLINRGRYRYKNLLNKAILKLNGDRYITTNASISDLKIDIKNIEINFAKPFVKIDDKYNISSFKLEETTIPNRDSKSSERVLLDSKMDRDDLFLVLNNIRQIDTISSPHELYEMEVTRRSASIQENSSKKLKREEPDLIYEKDLLPVKEEDNYNIFDSNDFIEEEDIENAIVCKDRVIDISIEESDEKEEDEIKHIINPKISGKYFVISRVNSKSTLTDIEKGDIRDDRIVFYKNDSEVEVDVNCPVYPIDAAFLDRYLKYSGKSYESLNLDDYIFYLKSQLISDKDIESIVLSLFEDVRKEIKNEIKTKGIKLINNRDKFVRERLKGISKRIENIESSRAWSKSFFSVLNTLTSTIFNIIPGGGLLASRICSSIISGIEVDMTGSASFNAFLNGGGVGNIGIGNFGLGLNYDSINKFSLNTSLSNDYYSFNSRGLNFGIGGNYNGFNGGLDSESGLYGGYREEKGSFNIDRSGMNCRVIKGNNSLSFGCGFDFYKEKCISGVNIGYEYNPIKQIKSDKGNFTNGCSAATFGASLSLDDNCIKAKGNVGYVNNTLYSDRTKKGKVEISLGYNHKKGYEQCGGSIFMNNKKLLNLSLGNDLATGEPISSSINLAPLLSELIHEGGLFALETVRKKKFTNEFNAIIKKAYDKYKKRGSSDDAEKFIKDNLTDKINHLLKNELDTKFSLNGESYDVSEEAVKQIIRSVDGSEDLAIILDLIYANDKKAQNNIKITKKMFEDKDKYFKEIDKGSDTILSNSAEIVNSIFGAKKTCHKLDLKVGNQSVTLNALPSELIGTGVEKYDKTIYQKGGEFVVVGFKRKKGILTKVENTFAKKDIGGDHKKMEDINFVVREDGNGNDIIVMEVTENIYKEQIDGKESIANKQKREEAENSDIKLNCDIEKHGKKLYFIKNGELTAINKNEEYITQVKAFVSKNGEGKEVFNVSFLKCMGKSIQDRIKDRKDDINNIDSLKRVIEEEVDNFKNHLEAANKRIIKGIKGSFKNSISRITTRTSIRKIERDVDSFIETINEECEKELKSIDTIFNRVIDNELTNKNNKKASKFTFEKLVQKLDKELGRRLEGYNRGGVVGNEKRYITEIVEDELKLSEIDLENSINKLDSKELKNIVANLFNKKKITSNNLTKAMKDIISSKKLNKKEKAKIIGESLIYLHRHKIDSYLDKEFVSFYKQNRENILNNSHGEHLLKSKNILYLDRSILNTKDRSFEEFNKNISKNVENNTLLHDEGVDPATFIKKIRNNTRNSYISKKASDGGYEFIVKGKKEDDLIAEINEQLGKCKNKEEAIEQMSKYIFANSHSIKQFFEINQCSSQIASIAIAAELTKKSLDKISSDEYNFVCDNNYEEKYNVVPTNKMVHFFKPDREHEGIKGNKDEVRESNINLIDWGDDGERVKRYRTHIKENVEEGVYSFTIPTQFNASALSSKTSWIFNSRIHIPKPDRSN